MSRKNGHFLSILGRGWVHRTAAARFLHALPAYRPRRERWAPAFLLRRRTQPETPRPQNRQRCNKLSLHKRRVPVPSWQTSPGSTYCLWLPVCDTHTAKQNQPAKPSTALSRPPFSADPCLQDFAQRCDDRGAREDPLGKPQRCNRRTRRADGPKVQGSKRSKSLPSRQATAFRTF